jgi:hypothetical protein
MDVTLNASRSWEKFWKKVSLGEEAGGKEPGFMKHSLEVPPLKNDGRQDEQENRIDHPITDDQRHLHHADIKLVDHMAL